jgi:hypothetical protein
MKVLPRVRKYIKIPLGITKPFSRGPPATKRSKIVADNAMMKSGKK